MLVTGVIELPEFPRTSRIACRVAVAEVALGRETTACR